MDEIKEMNRRCENRVYVKDILQIKARKGGLFTKTALGKSCDLSVHGIRFTSSVKFRRSSVLKLDLSFPGEFPGIKKLQLQARVISMAKSHRDGFYHISCRLLDVEPASQELIRQFMWWFDVSAQPVSALQKSF